MASPLTEKVTHNRSKQVREQLKKELEFDLDEAVRSFTDLLGLNLEGVQDKSQFPVNTRRIQVGQNPQESHGLRVEGNKFVFETVLPGADKKDVQVQLEGEFLRVEYKPVTPNRFSPSFARRWNVGRTSASKVSATLVNGVLRVEVEREEVEQPKVVKIFVV